MIIIKNGKILTMADKTYEKGDILIDGKIIKKIGEDIIAPEDAKVIDAEGMWIIPGIVDPHCHIGMFEDGMSFEGSDGNEATDPVTPELRAIDAVNPDDNSFREAREHGVTTVVTGPGSANVIGGQFAALKTYGRRIEEMILKEPLAVKVAFGENPKRVYSGQNKAPSTRMATAAILRQALIKAQEYKAKLEKGKKDPDKMPERDLKMEILVKVLNKELPLKAHAHRADDILTALRIAKEFDVNITLDHCTEGHLIADYLLEENAKVIVGPLLSSREKIELKNLSFKAPAILSKAGVKVAMMTDHPVIPVQYLPVCASIAVREGMDEMEALKSITINAAEITGISDRVGSLEVGKDADIAIFTGNPLDIRSKTEYVFIDGNLVFKRQ
ncbi:MAG: amidohydrolase [Xylanivirga thermophila]|jgi:imidazolonepropionase-like amidohydrolase|uniref:amidohydrolase n=1 Tax=Xylanivirga thermophila TaxID=2496273 RepID=UPI0039F5654A